MRSDMKNLVGKKFGKLSPISPTVKNNRTYWRCICDCGGEKTLRSDALIGGLTGNCGCDTSRLISESNRLPEGDAHINLAFHFYKKSARDRELEFALTRDEFIAISSGDCSYCGKIATKEDAPYIRDNLLSLHPINGIDRVDSSKGYTLDNSTPCCSRCNQIKMDMDINDFVSHARKIVSHFEKIGLGGYVVGRSAEKGIKSWKGKSKNE